MAIEVVPPSTLYARSAHGAIPIHMREGGVYEIPVLPVVTASRPMLAGTSYKSGRALLTALTGHKDHGLTLRRYFRYDPHQDANTSPSCGVLDVISEVQHALTVTPSILVVPPMPGVTAHQTQITVTSKERTLDGFQPGGLGIDLATRGREVRKLLFAGFGARMARWGYDPEEVLQEIFRGILARNKGRCPFDASKSSFGHYCWMIIECVLNNWSRKESRKREMEQVGILGHSGDSDARMMVDVSQAAERMVFGTPSEEGSGSAGTLVRFLTRMPDDPRIPLTEEEREDLRVIVPLLLNGTTRSELTRVSGLPHSRVVEAMTRIQEHVPRGG